MKKYIIVLLLTIMSIVTFSGCGTNRERELYVAPDDVALLSIYADNGASESNFFVRNLGHAFLSVENISSASFNVGDREVKPSETITVGLWSILEHFGVWYNVESNYIKEHNKYNTRVSITIGISLDDLDKVSKIIDENNKWTPLYNCSKFALEIWNAVAQDSEKIDAKFITSPSYLVNEISKFEEYEKNRPCDTDQVIRYYKEA